MFWGRLFQMWGQSVKKCKSHFDLNASSTYKHKYTHSCVSHRANCHNLKQNKAKSTWAASTNKGGGGILCLWWSLFTLCLLACQVWGIVSNSIVLPLLCLCDVFPALVNSSVCWLCESWTNCLWPHWAAFFIRTCGYVWFIISSLMVIASTSELLFILYSSITWGDQH